MIKTTFVRLAIAMSGIAMCLMALVHAEPPQCVGNGLLGQTMTCIGDCPGSQTCKLIQHRANNNTLYTWCGCSNSSQDNEPTCCHLIQLAGGTYSVKGDCISCPLQGACELGGDGTLTKPFSAACQG